MKRLGILVRWGTAAVVGAALVLPSAVGAQVPAQGITVHGHWVIEVRNADGSVQERRVFENALLASGKATLMNLFTGAAPIGKWQVIVNGFPGPCGGQCNMVEPTSAALAGGKTFKNLTKTTTPTTSEFVLQGSFVASSNGNVSFVFSVIEAPLSTSFFTQASPASIAVQATQTVSVTVTFSFS